MKALRIIAALLLIGIVGMLVFATVGVPLGVVLFEGMHP